MDSFLLPNTDPLKLRTSKLIIEAKLLTFFEKMKRIAAFLHKNDAPIDLQIKPEEIFLECYIDKPAIARLMTIAMQEDFAQFAVFFGLEDPKTHLQQKPETDNSFGQMTTCFLGLDANQNILGCHFPPNPANKTAAAVIDGEDTWPPPPIGVAPAGVVANLPFDKDKAFTLESDETDIKDYFEKHLGTKPPTT